MKKSSDKIKILIADDHPIFRRGLKYALSKCPDMEVRGEAACGREIFDKLRKNDYTVLTLDISLLGQNSLDTMKQIKKEFPRLPILILSVYPENSFGMRFIKSGASGYLTKEEAPGQLIEAVRTVANGRKYVSADLKDRLAFDFANQDKPPHEYLSDKEYQVFGKIGEGKSLTAIGKELSLSVKTIRAYRTHILEKMKMKNSAQIIQYAILNKLF